MNKNLEEIFELYNSVEKAKEELNALEAKLKAKCNDKDVSVDTFSDCSYDSLKEFYGLYRYYFEQPMRDELDKLLKKKRIEAYPIFNHPTYYPEIDQLQISESEKLRLDEAARWAVNYYITAENGNNLRRPLSIDDMEKLYSIGVAEKYYQFACPICGDYIQMFSESDLEKYKRKWYLNSLGNSLTVEEKKEKEDLYEAGFDYLTICCIDCMEYSGEICDENTLNRYTDNMRAVYKITKSPDVQCEKL